MTGDVIDADWLVFHPNAKVPNFVLPEGALDADCHVVSPSPDFPFAPELKITRCKAGISSR